MLLMMMVVVVPVMLVMLVDDGYGRKEGGTWIKSAYAGGWSVRQRELLGEARVAAGSDYCAVF